MTTKERINTALIRAIVENYSMSEGDINALVQGITQQLTVVYRQTIQSQLTLYSCQKLATGPDRTSMDWIEEKALKDAKGIANTYQRELENKVQSLYLANKKGNRNYYASNLNTWFAARSVRKSRDISLNTMTAAREYAKDRFITENGIEGKFVFTGPPPVCNLCIRIKGLGPLTYKQTRLARNRLPAHVGCPHTFSQLIPKKIDCGDGTWTG
jgi:hypothetical protein